MKVLSVLKRGTAITNKKFGLVIILLIINIVFALVFSFPMFYTLQNSFGDSLVSENMLKGFDTLWYGEFQSEVSGFASSFNPSIIGIGGILNNFVIIERSNLFNIFNVRNIPSAILILSLLYLILGTFLNGGILGAFNSPERKFSFRNFFEDCGRYFFRFLILMIGIVAVYVVLGIRFFPWLEGVFNGSSLVENAAGEIIPFLFDRLRNFIFIIILFFVGMLFDYIKIITVVEQRRNLIISFFKSLIFIIRYIFRTFSLYYILVFIGIIFILIYTLVESLIPQTTLTTILIALGIQQIYILLKIWLKCTFFSSQMSLYKGITQPEVKEEFIQKKTEPFATKEEPGSGESTPQP